MTEFPEIKDSLFCVTCGEKQEYPIHTHKCSSERCGYGGCSSVHAFVPAVLKESVVALARKLAHHLRFSTSHNVKQVREELLRVAEEDGKVDGHG